MRGDVVVAGVGVGVVLGVGVCGAAGGVTAVSQVRGVEVEFSNPMGDSVGVESFARGVFDQSVTGVVFDDDTGATAEGSAAQRSFVGDRGVTMSGVVSAFGSTDGNATARSGLEVIFEVTQETAYGVSLDLVDLFQGNPSLFVSASLVEDGGGEVWRLSSDDVFLPDTGSFSFDALMGTVGPGRYTLDVLVSVTGFEDATTSAGYELAFAIPSAGSGVVVAMGCGVVWRRRRAVRRG